MLNKISVIVPNFNNSKWLADCLESVLCQSFLDWECIVVDDGSTDDSVKIIKEFIKRDKRFSLIEQENKGLSAARNTGLDACNSEYVAFLDSDDCFVQTILETLYYTAEMNNADIVGGQVVFVNEDFRFIPSSAPADFRNISFTIFNDYRELPVACVSTQTTVSYVWRRLFRRNVIGEKRFLSGVHQVEDTLFVLDVMPNCKRFIESRAMAVYHRITQTSLTRGDFKPQNFQWIIPAFTHIYDGLHHLYPPPFWKWFYDNFMRVLFIEAVMPSIQTEMYKTEIASSLRKIYGTKYLPMKSLRIKQRVLLWFFIMGNSARQSKVKISTDWSLESYSEWLKQRGILLGRAAADGNDHFYPENQRPMFTRNVKIDRAWHSRFLSRIKARIWNHIGDRARLRYAEKHYNYTQNDRIYKSLCELREIKRNKAPHPKTDPILVAACKNEMALLPDFLRHYRKLGIRKFVFIDNASDDGTLEFLKAQPDCDLYQVRDEYNYVKQNTWRAMILEKYGANRWYLCVDADELLVYQNCETISISKFVRKMQRRGIRHIRAQLVDMYCSGPILDKKYDNGDSLIENYPYFDSDGYLERFLAHTPVRFGGPRKRLFDKPALLTKIPLFLYKRGEQTGSHNFIPFFLNFSDCYMGLLHFKYMPGALEKFRQFVDASIHWNGSEEYKAYCRGFSENPKLNFVYPGSIKFESSQSLVDAGIIEELPWARHHLSGQGKTKVARLKIPVLD
ncbi:MAG: glycosyltransferase [Rickettsiales bacterium]|jgi:glycosyltransferase involved in cell wall biosynthesis|nr:glycosyltransferase [Rickettsiales bacterium]